MKILIVGKWIWPQYENSFSKALESFGHKVHPFFSENFFPNSFFGKAQRMLPPLTGPALLKLNWKVWRIVRKEKFDLVLFWRPTHILPILINSINHSGVSTVSYNNDDPFGPSVGTDLPWHHKFLWFWYLKGLKSFNYNFFYRKINCDEALEYGAKHARVMMPYFIPWRDRPIKLTKDEILRFSTDIVFIGHYENDGREIYIKEILKYGYNFKLYGGKYWSQKVLGEYYEKLSPIETIEGDEYTKALIGSKICLCFLSKLNRDQYTRRCFEIPACRKLLLSERTKDLSEIFEEDKEACFFSSVDELIEKIDWLLKTPGLIDEISEAGYKKVINNNYDVYSRANEFLTEIKN